MPGRRETRAIAAWGDIDLTDDVKPRRPDLADDEIDTVETATEAYVEEYAELYGARDAVYALDSVGGLYIMGAPESTLPIISALRDDPDGRDRFVSEFIDRSNEYLEAAEERVNERVDGAAELIDPDWCNNKNRPCKAPLSIHAKHDAVVTPIDTDAPRYEFTPIEAVDDELVDDATEWARAFTADDHAACVDSLIETLWPDEYDETGSWIKAIRLWLEREREAERREREQIENAVAEENDRVETHEIPDGARTITTAIEDVFRAVDDISIGPLIRKYCAEWEPTGRPDHFDPGSSLWKDSDSGETCFVNPSKNIFVDIGKNGGKGGPAKLIALKEDIINYPSDTLGGARYWRAIDALRSKGYDIPEFVPEAGSTDGDGNVYEKTPYGALKRAAVAAGVVPTDAFVGRENDDGSTYEVFPGETTFNRTLAELEDRGIDHGWEYRGTDADRERARSRITRAETERRIDDQLGDDEAKAGLARLIADSKLSASE